MLIVDKTMNEPNPNVNFLGWHMKEANKWSPWWDPLLRWIVLNCPQFKNSSSSHAFSVDTAILFAYSDLILGLKILRRISISCKNTLKLKSLSKVWIMEPVLHSINP